MSKSLLFIAIVAGLVVLCLSSSTLNGGSKDPPCNAECKDVCYHGGNELEEYKGDDDSSSDDAYARIANAVTTVIGICLKQLVDANYGKNLVTTVCPLMEYLAKLAIFSVDPRPLLDILQLKNTDEARTMLDMYSKIISADKNTNLVTKIYADNANTFSKCFKKTNKQYFCSETGNENYRNATVAAENISDWLKNTLCREGEDDIIQSNEICDTTGLTFVGATEFKCVFSKQFKFLKTVILDFKQCNNEITKLLAYSGIGIVKYANLKELGAEKLEFLLEDNSTFVIIVPKISTCLKQLVYDLADPKVFNKIANSGTYLYADVTLPFNEYVYGKEDYVLGIKSSGLIHLILDPSYNGFSGIFEDCTKSGYVSNMKHKIYLTFESGLQTFGSTIEYTPRGCSQPPRPPKVKIEVNRRYIYYIRKSSGIVDFAGIKCDDQ